MVDVDVIEKDIKFLLYDMNYNIFYIENGLWLEFKSADIKIKYDVDFGWVTYIEEYNKSLEDEIDSIYNTLNNYVLNINEKLCS